jgi:kinesin family protein 4/21/27
MMLVHRQLQQREELGRSLEQLVRRRDHALISRQNLSVIRDLEDEIESMKANIEYVQESIAESQANIMQIEESKVCIGFLFPCTVFYERIAAVLISLQGSG